MLIYLATNAVNGMQYVGATTRKTLEPRIKENFKYAERKTRTRGSFANAIRKYGRKNISFKVLERITDIELLGECEKKWIKELNTIQPNGYNVKTGGMPKEVPSVTRNKSYTVNGVKYNSIMSLAEAYGVCHHNVRHRLLRSSLKWSVEQALDLAPPPKIDPVKFCKSIEVKGKTFRSQADAARHYGVAVKVFRLRMLKGWPLEEALNIKERPNQRRVISCKNRRSSKRRKVTLRGTTYSSISHAAEELGVPYGRVLQRLKRGWSEEQAFDLEPAPRVQKKGFDFLGYPSITAAAQENNINLTTLCQRLKKGWPPKKALFQPITPNDGSRGGLKFSKRRHQ